jgi:hypothetical protein
VAGIVSIHRGLPVAEVNMPDLHMCVSVYVHAHVCVYDKKHF